MIQFFTDQFREAFAERSEPDLMGGCQLWLGGLDGDGYGRVKLRGFRVGAHRVAWALDHGDIPPGMHVLHKCDIRCCVNGAHLWIGTNDDNVADMFSKGRALCGEASPRSVLTADDVRAARALYGTGTPISEIAKAFPVKRDAIKRAVTRKSWGHLDAI